MSAYVPESERTTAWWIWNKLFMCRVPYLQTMSPDYIREYGVLASGDPVRDKALSSEMTTTMLSIAKMIEYYGKGVTVGVVRYEDTKKIYEYISNHLQAWKRELEYSVHADAPVDDLLLMDRFASAVYTHARHQFTQDYADGIIARRLAGGMAVNKNTLFKPKAESVPVTNPDDPHENLPARQSMADVFASRRAITTKPKWR